MMALIWLAMLMIAPSPTLADNLDGTPGIGKHLVVYGSINDRHLRRIANDFGVIVTNLATYRQVEKIKRLNPAAVVFMYKDIFAMHPYYEDWKMVNENEEYFLHDQLLGLRLKERYFGWYVMDIANKGWIEHFANFVTLKLEVLKGFNGVFADDVWKDFNVNRFYVDIEDEESTVGADGKIVVKYSLLNTTVGNRANRIRIRVNKDRKGIDYFGNGSFGGRTITPKIPLTPGTKVYVDYSASDPKIIRPREDKITNWRRNMANMLQQVKIKLGKRPLIINSNELSGQFLGIADGIMAEGFGATELQGWEDQVRALEMARKMGKYYLAQINIKDGKSFTKHTDQTDRINYSLASFLIARGSFSSFSVGINDYSTLFFEDQALNQLISKYEKANTLLGKAISDRFVYAEKKGGADSAYDNLVVNGSFEKGMAGWTIAQKCLGTPDISTVSFNGAKSIHFQSTRNCGSTLVSGFIPVRPGTMYKLGASAKGRNIISGDSDWKKLCLIGRFYDIERKRLPDVIADLQFDLGSYDWKNYRKVYLSPNNAYFFKIISLGLYPTATGEGCIDEVFLKKDVESDAYKVYAKQFENGIILVNPTKAKYTTRFNKPHHNVFGELVNESTLNPHDAIVLFRQ